MYNTLIYTLCTLGISQDTLAERSKSKFDAGVNYVIG